ncbi:Pre-mRNA-processing factor 39 [Hordeum vulgare]|nr:Pre-mRNA-processing factor 39 [Hordeum vulgare]
MAEAIALSAAGDCVVLPLAPPSPDKLKLMPTALKPHEYIWEGVVSEWMTVPPIWMGAMPEQEQIYLEHSRQHHLRAECEEGKHLKKWVEDTDA